LAPTRELASFKKLALVGLPAFCRSPSTALEICDLTAVRFVDDGDGDRNFLTALSPMPGVANDSCSGCKQKRHATSKKRHATSQSVARRHA
jgi:hypothetical protein